MTSATPDGRLEARLAGMGDGAIDAAGAKVSPPPAVALGAARKSAAPKTARVVVPKTIDRVLINFSFRRRLATH
jgi:hypothetical protein